MADTKTIRISVFRYDPEQGRPYYQDYELPQEASRSVIDALFHLQADDPDPPAFRPYKCHRGQCASCVMTIDGTTKRACTTIVRNQMVIEPLYDYPVIKDLVVDFGTRRTADSGPPHLVRTGSIILTSSNRRPRALRGPWVRMSVDGGSCLECDDKPCVRACPVNRIENLEDRDGMRLEPFSGPIRIEDGQARLAGVCNICQTWPCAEKCPTAAFRVTAKGAGTGISAKRCIGCGLCLVACAQGNIWMNLERGYAVKCDLCGGDPACLRACPKSAISFELVGLP